ncbi:peptide ABC transporter substrate-binding protein [Streptomyces odontomachi]|uniref:peptide ABC transporter substrate-binding protein n=1 Tax=Streptomyces odontomachi TaxID=2944940 RepID=UPI00210EE1A0|nr:ABC transporter substrate-binding protein [Streptomyces sp. ODS25]
MVSLLVAASGACAGPGTRGATAGPDGGSFTVGVPAWYVAHLTPGRAGKSSVADAVWTPLTRIDASGKVRNAVAESIRSRDHRHWTIRLKAHGTFQNGEPVTAQSFADSWNASAYGPNAMPYGYLFAGIEGYADLNPLKGRPTAKTLSGVQVVDPLTLRVTLAKPLSVFPYTLASTVFAPMPKAAFKDLAGYDRRPIGNGPYEVAAPGLQPGSQQLTLTRFDHYAGRPGGAARITVKTYQDDATAYTNFQAGAVDLALATGSQLAQARHARPEQVSTAVTGSVVYLGFPLWDRAFADPRLRRAFSLAVNRRAVAHALLQDLAHPATGITSDVVTGGGRPACGDCRYDPAQARRLLAAAGGWHGHLTLWTQQDPLMQTVLEAVLNQLRSNLGITSITLRAQPTDQLYPNLAAHRTNGPFLLYMGPAYPTLYAQADQLFSAASFTNTTGYRSTRFTDLLTRAAAAGSTARTTDLSQQAERTALADLPLAPLYHPVSGAVHAKNLDGVRLDYLGDVQLAHITVR